MRNVQGPKDLKVGDLVQFSDDHDYHPQHFEGSITRVGETSATVSVNGVKRAVRYTRHTKGIARTVMRLLEPFDRWQREKPSGIIHTPAGMIIEMELCSDAEKSVAALRAGCAWLSRKPKETAR